MNRTALFAILLTLLLGCAIAAPPARGQAPAGPLPPKPGVAPEKVPPQQLAKTPAPIRVRVNLVSMPVTVRDTKNELVFDLSANDFHVYDNGKEQKIEHFDLGGDPLSIVLLVETSSHIEPLLPAIRKSGIVFTQTVMGQTGEAAVMGFNDQSAVLQPFTGNHDAIEKVLNHLPEGTSGIKLYDSMLEAVRLLQKQPENRRRVLLVMSEAVDSGSEARLGEVLRAAQLSNVAIYTIGLSTTAAELRAKPSDNGPTRVGPPGTFPLPGIPGRPDTQSTQDEQYGNINLLALAVWVVQRAANVAHEQSLAVASTATGGAHVNTFRDQTIEKALDAIGGELHAQYTLGYRPPGDEPSGYHEIKVSVSRLNVKVRTRPGYYLPPPPAGN
jgi:VWFA-related protein